MSKGTIINFGKIGGRRAVTFHVSNDGKVVPAKFRKGEWDCAETLSVLDEMGELISAHESFRRWKIARKAWHTRKFRNQLSLF
jgi:hypothetical protein